MLFLAYFLELQLEKQNKIKKNKMNIYIYIYIYVYIYIYICTKNELKVRELVLRPSIYCNYFVSKMILSKFIYCI